MLKVTVPTAGVSNLLESQKAASIESESLPEADQEKVVSYTSIIYVHQILLDLYILCTKNDEKFPAPEEENLAEEEKAAATDESMEKQQSGVSLR